MCEDHELPTLELARLTHDLAKYLIANGLGRLDEPSTLARRTSLAHHMFQTFTGSFAGHLHQSERRNRGDVGLHVIIAECFLQPLDHLSAVLGFFHVDEVDDDDAAEIAQAQLPGDGYRGLQVSAKNRFLQIS